METWGAQAENVARYLARGRQIAVDGRLHWSEYEVNGRKRQLHRIVAENVQYLPQSAGDPSGRSASDDPAAGEAAAVSGDEEIPF